MLFAFYNEKALKRHDQNGHAAFLKSQVFLQLCQTFLDLLQLLLVQGKLGLLLLHESRGSLRHESLVVQFAFRTGDLLLQVIDFLLQAGNLLV